MSPEPEVTWKEAVRRGGCGHCWKENGMCPIREGVLGMEAKEEAALCPLNVQVGVEAAGEETDRGYDSETCGSSSWKQTRRGEPTQPPTQMPPGFPANGLHLTQACRPCFPAQLTRACESRRGPSHLSLASCLQLPKRRNKER